MILGLALGLQSSQKSREKKIMIAALIFGFAFGAFMQHARVNRNDVIVGMAVLDDFTAAKTMGLAIGIGILLLAWEVELGLATYHVKPVILGGLIWGGLVRQRGSRGRNGHRAGDGAIREQYLQVLHRPS